MPASLSDQSAASALLDELNSARASAGLPALAADTAVQAVALAHSNDMANKRRLSHSSSDDRDFAQRMKQLAGVQRAGENLATGRGGATGMPDVARAFLNSPVHRANLLGEGFTKAGIAIVADASGTGWITVIFTD